MTIWTSEAPPPDSRITGAGWARAVLRGLALGLLTFGGLALMLLLRLVERPLYGAVRPVTPYITQIVCRATFVILGMRHTRRGLPMQGPGAMVANHASWLDIFALNAGSRLYFVSKSEVAGWPGIGWLARATGTLFITREARDARSQRAIVAERLKAGHRLCLFPEGTSTDGRRVLRFKSTLFDAFFSANGTGELQVQPITVIYRAPAQADPRHYGWWGGMGFGAHLCRTLATRPQGAVEVVYHAPMKIADYADRKALAGAAEAEIRATLAAALGAAP